MKRRRSRASNGATRVIADMSAVPEGWVSMNSIAEEMGGNGTPVTTVNGWLSTAHRRGELKAVKLVRTLGEIKTGPVFVPRLVAIQLVQQRMAEREAPEPEPEPEPAKTQVSPNEPAHRGGNDRLDRLEEMLLVLSDQVIRSALRMEDMLAKLSDRVSDNFIGVRERLADLQAAVELCAEANSTVSESDPEDDLSADGVQFAAPMGNGKTRIGLVNRE